MELNDVFVETYYAMIYWLRIWKKKPFKWWYSWSVGRAWAGTARRWPDVLLGRAGPWFQVLGPARHGPVKFRALSARHGSARSTMGPCRAGPARPNFQLYPVRWAQPTTATPLSVSYPSVCSSILNGMRLLCSSVWERAILYYKSWNNWNPFSPRLGPPYSSQRPYLSAREVWQEMWRPMVLTFLKCFCQNVNTFYTKHFCLPIFVSTYYFPCVILACILFFF